MAEFSLVAVGVGIKFISHISVEAKAHIEQSEKVLYLVNDPLMKDWIESINPKSESLDELYMRYPLRSDCYILISDYILETVRKDIHVCVVLYGHPSVFAEPALIAVRRAKQLGYVSKILPAISAEDCLFADLIIDPGSCGCQSFEATDFMIRNRNFDISSHLVLWQVGVIGNLRHVKTKNSEIGINVLFEYLKRFYSIDHEVILYEAAQYPDFKPRIDRIALDMLPSQELSRVTTLYVPPVKKNSFNRSVLKALHLDLELEKLR